MNFTIGMEFGEENEAIGIIVPALNNELYSCYSASDSEEDVLTSAKEAISLVLDEMANSNPELIAKISDLGIRQYKEDEEFSEYNNWGIIDFDITPYLGKQKRINISLSEGLIKTIDSFVDSKAEYKDRSHFLEIAARHEFRT